jgi:hypothetical protein
VDLNHGPTGLQPVALPLSYVSIVLGGGVWGEGGVWGVRGSASHPRYVAGRTRTCALESMGS